MRHALRTKTSASVKAEKKLKWETMMTQEDLRDDLKSSFKAFAKYDRDKLKDGEPCEHKGCLNHVTHPCEVCGRVAGVREKIINKRLSINEDDPDYDMELAMKVEVTLDGVVESMAVTADPIKGELWRYKYNKEIPIHGDYEIEHCKGVVVIRLK